MAHKHGFDAATDFLHDAGEHMSGGGKLRVTDLAESGKQLDGRHSKRNGGINLKKVAEVLVEYGLDPTEEIVKVLPNLDENMKSKVLLELLSYCQPKLKAVEHSGPGGNPIEMSGVFNVNFKGTK